jgi:hypothetical protein
LAEFFVVEVGHHFEAGDQRDFLKSSLTIRSIGSGGRR